jgi:hypothetical protein
MNQDDLARQIVDRLDRNLNELPADIVGRLAHARQRALQARPRPHNWRVRFADWALSHRMAFKVALPALFLVVAVGAVYLLQSTSREDPFDVETALMADELPLHAYTDPGFDTWLKKTSHEEQQ